MRPKFSSAWIALFILALASALLFESQSVERIPFEIGDIEPSRSIRPRTEQGPAMARGPRENRLTAGARFSSLEELVNGQFVAGFVRTGIFGNHWPAEVVEIASDRHGISFVRQDGTRHNQTKFHGYDMKMVRLRAGNKETIVVFRSQYKK